MQPHVPPIAAHPYHPSPPQLPCVNVLFMFRFVPEQQAHRVKMASLIYDGLLNSTKDAYEKQNKKYKVRDVHGLGCMHIVHMSLFNTLQYCTHLWWNACNVIVLTLLWVGATVVFKVRRVRA
jgi:hypothetical protein